MRIIRDFDASIYKSRQTCVGNIPTKELLASRVWVPNPQRNERDDRKYIPNDFATVRYATFYDRKTGNALRFEGDEVTVWRGADNGALIYLGYSGPEYKFANDEIEEYFRRNFQWTTDQIVQVRMKLSVQLSAF